MFTILTAGLGVDGVGTELGGTALLIIIAKIVHELYRERKSKASAEKVVNGNPKPNPSVRLNGSSTDLILMMLKEHTDKITKIEENINNIKIDIARLEGPK